MHFQQVESHEPGSTTYNEQLWRRSRNEKIIGETQTQAEIAGKYSSPSTSYYQRWSAFPAHCEWDRPVSTLPATGTPLKVSLHAFDTLLVSANEYDKIRCVPCLLSCPSLRQMHCLFVAFGTGHNGNLSACSAIATRLPHLSLPFDSSTMTLTV